LCDDGIGCTRNECVGDMPEADANGCVFRPEDFRCPETDLCVPRRCDPVADCVDEPRECPDDGDPCTREFCDSADGECKRDVFCGACCVPNDQCRENVTQQDCETNLGGTFMGLGSECISSPCGACCEFDTGICIDGVLLSECDRIRGVFQGSDSICDADSCRGACCDPGFFLPGCYDNTTPEACAQISNDAVFVGVGVECANAPCGACCVTETSECGDAFTRQACEQRQWVYQGDGTACDPDNPCEGACCLPDGTCTVVLAEDCAGDFRGAGTACDELEPPCAPFPGGACCFDKECIDGTSAETCINSLGGDFQGAGTLCATADCAATGACCVGEGCGQLTRAGCAAFGALAGVETLFLGEGVPCAGEFADQCPARGACCQDIGPCVITRQRDCFGDYRGDGTTCPDACLGACCPPDGECIVTTDDQCPGQFGGAGSDCSEVTCKPFAPGACCAYYKGCRDNVSREFCESGLGPYANVYFGEGTTCATSDCGACCDKDSSYCVDGFTGTNCGQDGGVYQGAGSTCTGNPCQGACCKADGSCAVTAAEDCVGDFRGNGTACDELEPPCQPFAGGACCFEDGSCEDGVTKDTCTSVLGGSYQGDSTVCAQVDCTQTGACCDDRGQCEQTTEAACAAAGRTFLGVGSTCNPGGFFGDRCPISGACCLPDGSCAVRRPEDCPGFYRGDGTGCDELDPPCEPFSLGACCLEDGSCVETTDVNCYLGRLGLYEGDGTTCATTNCQAKGACCYTFDDPATNEKVIFACEQTTRRACEAAPALGAIFGLPTQSAFLGEGVPCSGPDGDMCPESLGACCQPDGSCNVAADEQCTGEYRGDGTACDELNPPCEPFGAGACCLEDNSCIDGVSDNYCYWTKQGEYQGDGTTCAGAVCQNKGACCASYETFGGRFRTDCYQTTRAGCTAAAAYFTKLELPTQVVFLGEGVPCAGTDEDVCPGGPVGACCLPDGNCAVTTDDDCPGDFRGTGTGCDELNPPCEPIPVGACCLLDNDSCVDGTTAIICYFRRNGDYQGDGTTCAATVCTALGACCYTLTEEDGTVVTECYQTTQQACEAVRAVLAGFGFEAQAVFLGEGISCEGVDDNLCPRGIASGACCQSDGRCVNRRPIDCPGDYRGDGTSCAEINPPCTPDVGACCIPNRGCLPDLTEAECVGEGGTFVGADVPCENSDCGACCDQDKQSCADGVFRIACLAESGTFKGSGSQCNSVNCCETDADCDDEKFCNGGETCIGGRCVSGEAPCDPVTETCDEETDSCSRTCNTKTTCDLNLDGGFDLLDYATFMLSSGRTMTDPQFDQCADYDGDGAITPADYLTWWQCSQASQEGN